MTHVKRCRCGEPLPPQTGKTKPRMCAECQKTYWREKARQKAIKQGRKQQPRSNPITTDTSLVVDWELGTVTLRYPVDSLPSALAQVNELMHTYASRGYQVRQIGHAPQRSDS